MKGVQFRCVYRGLFSGSKCVLVTVRRLYPISSSFPLATRLLDCIKDNYSTIDCHGGPITVFPVTDLGLKLHCTGDPSNSTLSNFKVQQFPLFCICGTWEDSLSESKLDLCVDNSLPGSRLWIAEYKELCQNRKSLWDVSEKLRLQTQLFNTVTLYLSL